MIPSTVERVPLHTADHVNEWIRRETELRVARCVAAGPQAIDRRLAELDQEWDIERTLEANAAMASLIGLTLGATVNRAWFLFPAAVAGFLLQHAVQGWCPPLPVFRRWGFRTASEIEEERVALKELRGDVPRGSSPTAASPASAAHSLSPQTQPQDGPPSGNSPTGGSPAASPPSATSPSATSPSATSPSATSPSVTPPSVTPTSGSRSAVRHSSNGVSEA